MIFTKPALRKVAPAGGLPPISNGLVGYWPMEEGSGTSTADLVAANDASFVDSPAWVAGQESPNAIDVGNKAGHLLTNDGTLLNNASAVSFTGWINLRTASANDGFFAWSQNSRIFKFAVGNATRNFIVVIQNFGVGFEFKESASNAFNLNTWTLVGVTYDAVSRECWTYSSNGSYSSQLTGFTRALQQESPIVFAVDPDVDPGRRLNGIVDEHRVYDRVLTEAEFRQIENGTG